LIRVFASTNIQWYIATTTFIVLQKYDNKLSVMTSF